jgi:hypothetical protein
MTGSREPTFKNSRTGIDEFASTSSETVTVPSRLEAALARKAPWNVPEPRTDKEPLRFETPSTVGKDTDRSQQILIGVGKERPLNRKIAIDASEASH